MTLNSINRDKNLSFASEKYKNSQSEQVKYVCFVPARSLLIDELRKKQNNTILTPVGTIKVFQDGSVIFQQRKEEVAN